MMMMTMNMKDSYCRVCENIRKGKDVRLEHGDYFAVVSDLWPVRDLSGANRATLIVFIPLNHLCGRCNIDQLSPLVASLAHPDSSNSCTLFTVLQRSFRYTSRLREL